MKNKRSFLADQADSKVYKMMSYPIFKCDATGWEGCLSSDYHSYIEMIKTFSYNMKDLAWGIESSAICITVIILLLRQLLG
jgi:hypothetical protein